MTKPSGSFLLVLTNLPDQDIAKRLAESLVEKRLAACVNILDGCTSVYRWQGDIQNDREIPMLIKTHIDRFAEAREEILRLHPYEVPEIVAVPIAQGFEPYLQWIAASVDLSS